MKCTIILSLGLLFGVNAMAQSTNSLPDSLDVYGDRSDSLNAAVFVSRQDGISKMKPIRTEVISAAGLCKMACCNLAESFENSASVTVGYSDAVTGARQIRLLGLSGIYTQMLDENRPVMRGISAPWGLTYVPGQWLSSIQIAKGSTSVINGVESMTGQINMEHRKPTDEIPLFVNASAMLDSKVDLNVASSLQIGEHWSTVILAHADKNFVSHDMNGDGFKDEPLATQVGFSNRWLYYAASGLQVRFGVRATWDNRNGGSKDKNSWQSHINNNSVNAYVKVGVPLNDDNSQNIAFVGDYTWQKMNSDFGPKTVYNPGSHSVIGNLLYQNQTIDWFHFTAGLGVVWDRLQVDFDRFGIKSNPLYNQTEARAFFEGTFKTLDDKFSTILGLNLNYYTGHGVRFSPRLTLKYAPIDDLVIRANAGRGLRFSNPLIDNIGVLSTGKTFVGLDSVGNPLEDAWTAGGNITYYLPFGLGSNYISFDYFHTNFAQQLVLDYDNCGANSIGFYMLDGKKSYTHTFQLDFSTEPIERFTITLTGRYSIAKAEYVNVGLIDRPMTSMYKAVLNLQYATNLNKWIFDFTASLNGPCTVYKFMEQAKDAQGNLLYPNGKTPIYPLLYLQVTKRFKMVDIYLGGENLTNFRQKNVLLGSYDAQGKIDPMSASFDASQVWGPLMGIKAYLGIRVTLWKKS
ncbi:MAG: TonB-dependent receptor [Bacteroidales bacterium]|nr:TonB-dependent receptor [Bacteroidales bacterium]